MLIDNESSLCTFGTESSVSGTYSADTIGVMLLDVGPDSSVHSVPPALHGAVYVLGPWVTGLLAQVIKLEGDLFLGVQDPAVSKISMLCD